LRIDIAQAQAQACAMLATQTPKQHQVGHALIEWIIVSLPLIWLGLLAIEVSGWHSTRQELALVAQQATLFASLSGGRTESIREHLIEHRSLLMRGEIQVCVKDQVSQLMRDFKDKRLSQQVGHDVIRHNHIIEQHRRFVAKGWANGRGPRSGQTISAANFLRVSVTLQHRPVTPVIRFFIPTITITSHHEAVMQSHRTQNPKACVTSKVR